jgi:steroid delta-isomerase-like uncharacterized protein
MGACLWAAHNKPVNPKQILQTSETPHWQERLIKTQFGGNQSLQLGVFGFGLVENRDVSVDVAPEREKVSVGRAGLVFVAGERVTSAVAPDEAAQNAAIIRAHHDLLNRGDWKTASTYFAEDTKNFGHPVGRERIAQILQDIWTTFPDFRMDIVDLFAKDDWVVVRCRTTGTHLGVGKLPVNGGLLVGVPPTHKHFEIETVHWYTLRDGEIVDHRGARDDLAMMGQLGLLPMPKPWAQVTAGGTELQNVNPAPAK